MKLFANLVRTALLPVVISLMVPAFVFAGGSSQAGGGKTTIGFVPMTLSNDYFILMVNGAKTEAKKQGVEIIVQASTTHADAEEQVRIIENLIERKVSAVCVVPSSSSSLLPVLKKAQDAKIPVINIDTILDPGALASAGIKPPPFEGTNNYEGAKLAGAYVKDRLYKDKPIKVAILNGIPGQQNASDRRNGFVDGAGNTIQVVAEQTANWEIEQGYNAAQNILSANKDLDLFFAGSDTMALGALRAVREANRQDSVKVIGFDGTSDAADSVEQGGLLATVAQDPGKMGVIGIQEAVALIKGQTVPANTDTGAQLITRDKVTGYKDYLKQYQ
jgi:ribose transport system substrate-binding protein